MSNQFFFFFRVEIVVSGPWPGDETPRPTGPWLEVGLIDLAPVGPCVSTQVWAQSEPLQKFCLGFWKFTYTVRNFCIKLSLHPVQKLFPGADRASIGHPIVWNETTRLIWARYGEQIIATHSAGFLNCQTGPRSGAVFHPRWGPYRRISARDVIEVFSVTYIKFKIL